MTLISNPFMVKVLTWARPTRIPDSTSYPYTVNGTPSWFTWMVLCLAHAASTVWLVFLGDVLNR